MHKYIRYSQRILKANKQQEPVVALESTILTHGLPEPLNRNIASEAEAIIYEKGAVPATIFINNGRIHIGAEENELDMLCFKNESAVKCSRRDIAGVLASKKLGGTTVSGTSMLAHLAGIEIFATGGIGGVHRGAETTMDISADLYELNRTPMTVVCAGVKSILDIGLTLEVLESLGVGVYTIGDSDDFPAFYLPKSGFKSPGGAISVEIAAEIMAYSKDLNMSSGIIFANPMDSTDDTDYEGWISQAVKEAQTQNISGNESTPFILSRLNHLSSGKTVQTNKTLYLSNCAKAAEIAVIHHHNKFLTLKS